jgi:hypothetical protein
LGNQILKYDFIHEVLKEIYINTSNVHAISAILALSAICALAGIKLNLENCVGFFRRYWAGMPQQCKQLNSLSDDTILLQKLLIPINYGANFSSGHFKKITT